MRKGVGKVNSLSGWGPLSTKTFWEETKPHLTVTSYVVKPKSTSKQNVLVLSTMQPILGMIRDDGKKKSAIIELYDFIKGRTDVVDRENTALNQSNQNGRCQAKMCW